MDNNQKRKKTEGKSDKRVRNHGHGERKHCIVYIHSKAYQKSDENNSRYVAWGLDHIPINLSLFLPSTNLFNINYSRHGNLLIYKSYDMSVVRLAELTTQMC
jgi:hypothetical protein